ncbi:hypothetical protein D3C80_1868170 [compost metagenome]
MNARTPSALVLQAFGLRLPVGLIRNLPQAIIPDAAACPVDSCSLALVAFLHLVIPVNTDAILVAEQCEGLAHPQTITG